MSDQQYNTVIKQKKLLIDNALSYFKIDSLLDLGGNWNVDGVYSKYIYDNSDCRDITIVDAYWDHKLTKDYEFYGINCIRETFSKFFEREPRHFDCTLIFDILLHQVSPNWKEIINHISTISKNILIFNPQWISTDETVRLTKLPNAEYLSNVPHNKDEYPYNNYLKNPWNICPETGICYKDSYCIWQWGITNVDLISSFHKQNFDLLFSQNFKGWDLLDNFENYGYIFRKMNS